MTEIAHRVLSLIEHITHELIQLVRDYFEILFITAIYLAGAYILAREGMREELSYWLTSGALVGSIVTLVNRFGATRYKNGGSEEVKTKTETTVEINRKPATETSSTTETKTKE